MARMGVPPSASELIAMLTPIWERALQRPSVGIEENFFELGGDPAAAGRIFTEVAQTCGRVLPPFVMYQAPTIASLAALLSQPGPPQFSPLVLLRPGTGGPPIFITHGLGGHLFEFFSLVRHMPNLLPIYGMQTRGMDGVAQPFDQIEDMAEYSLEAIKKVQPHGPYSLIGYSLGGLVTLEMASRLKESGEAIGLLAMIDSYPPVEALSWVQRTRLIIRLNMQQLASNLGLRHPSQKEKRATGESMVDEELYPAMKQVREKSRLALERYRPRFYAGNVHFVRAGIPTIFPADPTPVWGPWLKELAVETVPGDHHEILTEHAGDLASILSRYLRETRSSTG